MNLPIPSTWGEVLAWFLVAVLGQLALLWFSKRKATDAEEDAPIVSGCLLAPVVWGVQAISIVAFVAASWGLVRLIRI